MKKFIISTVMCMWFLSSCETSAECWERCINWGSSEAECMEECGWISEQVTEGGEQ